MQTLLRRSEGGAIEKTALHCCRGRCTRLPLDGPDLAPRLCEIFDGRGGIQRNECRQLVELGGVVLRIGRRREEESYDQDDDRHAEARGRRDESRPQFRSLRHFGHPSPDCA
jgi:hypothetical protein